MKAAPRGSAGVGTIVVAVSVRALSRSAAAVQDRYAGDIGDFGKLALLRALAPERRLGICWCIQPMAAASRTTMARHLAYLQRPERFRLLDPETFDALARFVGSRSGRADVVAVIARSPQPTAGRRGVPWRVVPREGRPTALAGRQRWLRPWRPQTSFSLPDTPQGANASPESRRLKELLALLLAWPNCVLRPLDHQTRHPGGAASEARHIASRPPAGAGFRASVDAVRLRPYSSRFYFLMDAEPTLRERLREFANRWGTGAELFLHLA